MNHGQWLKLGYTNQKLPGFTFSRFVYGGCVHPLCHEVPDLIKITLQSGHILHQGWLFSHKKGTNLATPLPVGV